MIHKVATRRGGASEGHKRCSSVGTDARLGGTVRVRVRCVIDRRGEGHSLQGIIEERKENVHSTVNRGEERGKIMKEK